MYNSVKKLIFTPTNKTSLQFIRYTLVGGIAFIVDISLLYFFTEYLHLHYLLSAGLSFLFGLVVNFSLSKKIIFINLGLKNPYFEFIIVGFIAIIGLGLNEILIWYTTEYIGLYYIYSKILAAIIVYSWNFFTRKYLLYK